ncbi:hypothetical protein ACHAXT_012548 [Thalassiosira profunda]
MAQANNYAAGNGVGHQAVPSTSAATASPATPNGGPVAVAAMMGQQSLQANFLQQNPFANQMQMQNQQQSTQAPQSQAFTPGPFYSLQQQQAFAQARLAAAAAQQQEQLRQAREEAQRQLQQQPGGAAQATQPQPQNMYAFPVAGQQQPAQQPAQNASVGGAMSMNYHTAAAAAANATAAAKPSTATVSTALTPAASMAPNGKKRKSSETKAAKKAPSPIHSPRKGAVGAKSPKVSGKKAGDSALPPAAASLTSGMSASATKLIENAMTESNGLDIPASTSTSPPTSDRAPAGRPLTAEEKRQTSRDRNREHARCTRLRKKAYVNKLKELVDGLHAERNEDARQRRVAVRHLAEVQELRRKVVRTFLGYHARYERDVGKWSTILETDFWLKQPVTPYRSFRRCEIQKGSRILKGVDAMVRDSASMSVMIETIGSRNLRWLQRKRDDFLTRDASKHASAGRTHRISHAGAGSGNSSMPHSIVRQNSRLQHAVSSLSSSSGSSTGNGSGAEEDQKMARSRKTQAKNGEGQTEKKAAVSGAKMISSSSSSNDTHKQLQQASNDFHDYHAPSLEDPLPESGNSSPSSQDADVLSDNCVVGGKRMCTDSSSSEEYQKPAAKKQKMPGAPEPPASVAQAPAGRLPSLPPNIAKSGGIFHNVKAIANPPPLGAASSSTTTSLPNGQANLSRAPATALPPFVGIGKRSVNTSMSADTGGNNNHSSSCSSSKPLSIAVPKPPTIHHPHGNSGSNEETNNGSNLSSSRSASHHHRGNIITIDDTCSSQSSSQNQRGIQANYHINEDDMIITDDVLMCPFIFRSQEAVWCGALAECVQPGMLRAKFSPTNKLRNVELIFDAMGFCQQLERASGKEGMAQIIPNSLEMALAPNSDEARVITEGKKPFRIVSVNEAWTAMTGYTQLDAEGKDLSLLEGERTDAEATKRSGMPLHDLEAVANGVCAASTNVHYDINGKEFLDFSCSYPLSNLSDQVTHILHVYQELPART